jgi:hypothetical protein
MANISETKGGTIACPLCGQKISVTKQGTVLIHNDRETGAFCALSGKPAGGNSEVA